MRIALLTACVINFKKVSIHTASRIGARLAVARVSRVSRVRVRVRVRVS